MTPATLFGFNLRLLKDVVEVLGDFEELIESPVMSSSVRSLHLLPELGMGGMGTPFWTHDIVLITLNIISTITTTGLPAPSTSYHYCF
jgi:hypothetical protein